jgi:hypothetical protein
MMLDKVLDLQIYDDTFTRGGFFGLVSFSHLSHALELSLDVDSTNGTVLARYKPLIDAVTMEQMHARQTSARERQKGQIDSEDELAAAVNSPNIIIDFELR